MYKAFKMFVKIQKLVLPIPDYHNATSTHDKANRITYMCTQCGLLLHVVLTFCVNEPFCGSGTAKYTPHMVLMIILCSFKYAYRKNYFSDIRFYPQPMITITIARCPANVITLSAIIVDLWLSEYPSKLRHDSQIAISGGTLDVFKIPSKKEY